MTRQRFNHLLYLVDRLNSTEEYKATISHGAYSNHIHIVMMGSDVCRAFYDTGEYSDDNGIISGDNGLEKAEAFIRMLIREDIVRGGTNELYA